VTREEREALRKLAEALKEAQGRCTCGPRWTGVRNMRSGLPDGDGNMHTAECGAREIKHGGGLVGAAIAEAAKPLNAWGAQAIPALLDALDAAKTEVARLHGPPGTEEQRRSGTPSA
jgi:hypothetical protein